jgi:hypothetical protein
VAVHCTGDFAEAAVLDSVVFDLDSK